MKKNTVLETQQIAAETINERFKLRQALLDLEVHESVTIGVNDWPYRSSLGGYLHTFHRIGREYGYMTRSETNEYVIIRKK